MNLDGLINIKKAISTLNPHDVRNSSERALRVVLHAADNTGYSRMEDFFLHDLSPARRRESALLLSRAPTSPNSPMPDFHVYSEEQLTLAPADALILNPNRPKPFITKTLSRHTDLGVPLARSFVPFRRPFVERAIAKTCRENTLFSVATALPDIVPNIIELPWAIAEFASDTAFLTMNQVRLAFLIAAASDREIGYMHQKSEIAMVIGSAFGWRALARQLIGKIPFGGGLIAKAAVAYAGTKVLGLSLDHYYSIGFTYTREERDKLYSEAFQQGKKVAAKMLHFLRPDLAARFSKQTHQTRPVIITPPARTEWSN